MPRVIHKSFFPMVKVNAGCVLSSVLIVLLALTSCSRKYKVEGTSSVTGLDGKVMLLKVLQDGDWVTVDSAEVVHGLFAMAGSADTTRMVTLYMDDEPLMPLVLEDGKVKVTISSAQLVAGGTPLNDRLYEFIDHRNALELQYRELVSKHSRMVLDGTNVDEVRQRLSKETEALTGELNNYIKQFITDNFENVLGPSIFMMMCSTLPYPVMTPEIEDIMRVAPASFKENPLVQDYLAKAKENMQLIEESRRLQQNAGQATAQR